jgi:hypothetical protein
MISGSQPTKGTIEAAVSGLAVEMSLASLRNLDVTGFCTITAVITFALLISHTISNDEREVSNCDG